MSLSERERHALEAIERALEADDPHFVASTSIDRLQQVRRRWVIIPAVMFVLGMILLVVGLVTTHAMLVVGVAISVVGVLTMATAIAIFVRRHSHG